MASCEVYRHNEPVRITTEQALLIRCEAANVIVQKGGRPVLVEELDGNARRMIKLWWFPGRAWRTLPHPGFERFCEACESLRDRDVVAPEVVERGQVAGSPVRWVVYPKIAGDPLNRLSDWKRFALLPSLSAWVRRLHDQGCYSRALSLANVLALPDARLGITDVSETQFSRRSLGYGRRVRNLGRFLAHPRDTAWWLESAGPRFIEDYARGACLAPDRLWRDVSRNVASRTRRRARRRRYKAPDRGAD